MSGKCKDSIKKIISFIIFMSIIALVFRDVTWLFRGNETKSRENVAWFSNERELDVILVGGSTVYRYYQPMEAWKEKGYTSYNYATSSARVDLAQNYIEESRRTHRAGLYVIDVRTVSMVSDKINASTLRNWSDSLGIFSYCRWKGITRYLFSRDVKDVDVAAYYFDIIKYHSQIGDLGDPYQWSYVNYSKNYNLSKGYEPDEGNHTSFEKPDIYKERGELTERQEEAINSLLDYCDKENLQVLFTVCPYIITQNDWKKLNTCGDIIQSRGYDFINFNEYYEEIGLDFATDFEDVNHVNYLGAEKYTSFLMNYLDDTYHLPDHRGEKGYEKWDEDYIEYQEVKRQWKDNITDLVSNHIEADQVAAELPHIDDFAKWYSYIRNSNFTILIEKTGEWKEAGWNYVYEQMLANWKISRESPNYVGIWRADKEIYSFNGEDAEYKGKMGIDAGRGRTAFQLSVGETTGIVIDGINYVKSGDGIWVVIFNNNTQKVADVVNILIDQNGDVVLAR